MKIHKEPGLLIIIMWIVLIIAFLISVRFAKAEEPIERAYINAPGQLVVDYAVGNMGIVHEVHTVVLTVNEPTFCGIPNDPRHAWFFFEGLLVEREPIKTRSRKICIEQKCKGNK